MTNARDLLWHIVKLDTRTIPRTITLCDAIMPLGFPSYSISLTEIPFDLVASLSLQTSLSGYSYGRIMFRVATDGFKTVIAANPFTVQQQ